MSSTSRRIEDVDILAAKTKHVSVVVDEMSEALTKTYNMIKDIDKVGNNLNNVKEIIGNMATSLQEAATVAETATKTMSKWAAEDDEIQNMKALRD